MWATLQGTAVGGSGAVGHEVGERHAAERPLVDEPQLGPVVGEVEPRRAGASPPARPARSHQQLAAHAQVGDQGLPVAVGGRAAPARGTCRAAAAARTWLPVEPGGEVGGPGQVPAGDPRLPRNSRRARWCGRRRGPARPRRTTSTSGSSGIRGVGRPRRLAGVGRPGARRRAALGAPGRARSRRSRRPSARPPSCCGRCPRRATSSPTTARAVKIFSWSGPSSVDAVLRDAERRPRRSAPAGWSSSPGRRRGVADCAISGSSRWCTNVGRRRHARATGRPCR